MESCTVKDQTEVSEDTRPILGQEDGADTNFPITNTSTVIDSEISDKKDRAVIEDQYKVTVGSEKTSDSGLIINADENMKYTLLKNSGAPKEDVKMKRDVRDAPLMHVDEDDGLMKKLGKLCGGDKQKLLQEEYEPYIKSHKHLKQNFMEAQEAGFEKEFHEMALRNVQKKQNERVSGILASQGNQNELSDEKQFDTPRSPGLVGSNARRHIHNELQIKNTNIESVRETQGGRQPVYEKNYETRVPEGRGGSYSNQTHAQIFPISGFSVSHTTRPIDSDMYNFTHSERGYMLTIVNDRFVDLSPRDGAHLDLQNMKEIAEKFGFRFFNYNQECNLSKSQTLQLLIRASKADHSDCDCFVFMISTHGLEKRNARKGGKVDHALVCADDQLIFTSTIMEMFNDENCPTLKGKPKIFFIQACRGENVDHGSTFVAFPRNEDKTCSASNEVEPNWLMRESFDVSDTRPGQDSWTTSQTVTIQGQTSDLRSHQITIQSNQTPPCTVPIIQQSTHVPHKTSQYRPNVQHASGRVTNRIYAPTPYNIVETPSIKCDNDMLVMFAIPPGMFAWRNNSEGSWMIDYLHQVLMAYDMRRPKSFLNLLTKVSALMSQRTTNTPWNPSLHEKKAVSVIEHKLDKDIVFQQKVSVSE